MNTCKIVPTSVHVPMSQAYTPRSATMAYGVNRSAILVQRRLEHLVAFRAQLGGVFPPLTNLNSTPTAPDPVPIPIESPPDSFRRSINRIRVLGGTRFFLVLGIIAVWDNICRVVKKKLRRDTASSATLCANERAEQKKTKHRKPPLATITRSIPNMNTVFVSGTQTCYGELSGKQYLHLKR